MKKKILSVALVVGNGCFHECSGADKAGKTSDSKESGELTKLSLGTTSWPTNMFFFLAEEKGFYEANGVDVTIQEFSSTTESTNAFVGGQLDFCTFASSRPFHHFFRERVFRCT